MENHSLFIERGARKIPNEDLSKSPSLHVMLTGYAGQTLQRTVMPGADSIFKTVNEFEEDRRNAQNDYISESSSSTKLKLNESTKRNAWLSLRDTVFSRV